MEFDPRTNSLFLLRWNGKERKGGSKTQRGTEVVRVILLLNYNVEMNARSNFLHNVKEDVVTV